MADRTSASRLNEAVADDSLDGPRHRAADWDEPFDLDEEPGPISGARRSKLSTVSADGSGPTPVEEMDDVSSDKDKEAAAVESDAKATSTPTTAAGSADPATGTSAADGSVATVSKHDAGAKAGETKPTLMTAAANPDAGKKSATGPKPAGSKPAAGKSTAGKPAGKTSGDKSVGKGGAALSAVGSGVARLRNLIASVVWLAAVLCAAVLALGALFTALSQTNESNEIVRWVLDRGHDLVGPFGDLFKLETAKNTLLVNWGIAALAYLVVGKVLERIIRP